MYTHEFAYLFDVSFDCDVSTVRSLHVIINNLSHHLPIKLNIKNAICALLFAVKPFAYR